MQLRNTLVEQATTIRIQIIHIISNSSGQSEANAEIRTIAILGYITVLIIMIVMHSKLIKTKKKYNKELVELYDTLRYQVAKAQYNNPSIQNNAGIKILMDAEHKNNETHIVEIKQEVVNMELASNQTIVSPEQRIHIEKQTKKRKKQNIIVQIIGRCTTIITAGIYKIFW